MTQYEPSWDLRRARQVYFDDNGFGDDGGYSDPWVTLKFGPIPFRFPNSPQRVRSVRLHDLHHIATGYPTDLAGEAEVGAWEIASNCQDHVAAWFLNLLAMAYGLLLFFPKTYRAFMRGRRSKNLYTWDFEETILTQTVAQLRQALLPQNEPVNPTGKDMLSFALWSSISGLTALLVTAISLCPLYFIYVILN